MAFADRTALRPVRSMDPAVKAVYDWARRLVQLHQSVPLVQGSLIDPTPVVWNALSSSPVLNNGTLDCEWRDFGDIVFIRLQLTIGAATTQGTGAWTFTLPFPPALVIEQSISGHIHHGGGGGAERAVSAIITNSSDIRPVVDGAGNRISTSTGLVAGDTLVLQGFYRPA